MKEAKSSFTKFIVGAFLLLAAWFGGYEVAERLFLKEHFREFLHVFHIIRGVLAAVLVGILIWRYAVRFQLSLYPQKDLQEAVVRRAVQTKKHTAKIILWYFIVSTLLAGILGWLVSDFLEQDLLDREKQTTAEFISEKIRNQFTEQELLVPKTGADYDDFSDKIKELYFGPGIERIKVWNKDKTIVWSNNRDLVGQQFVNNHELDEALKGEIVSEVSSAQKEEYIADEPFEHHLELYVPIQFEPGGEILSVVEIYKDLELFNKEVARKKWISLILVTFAAIFLGLLIPWYFSGFHVSLYPQPDLQESIFEQIPTKENILRHHAQWFITMRWFVCMIMGIASYVACYVFDFLEESLFLPLAVSTLCLVIFNVVFHYLSNLKISVKEFILFQIYVDLIILTILLHFSGGVENPFTFLYIFHVVISGILLNKKTCYYITLSAAVLFIIMAFGEFAEVFEHYAITLFPHEIGAGLDEELHAAHQIVYVSGCVFAQLLTLFMTAYFITAINVQLQRTRDAAFSAAQQAVEENEKLIGLMRSTGVGLGVLDAHGNLEWVEPTERSWEPSLEEELRTAILDLSKKDYEDRSYPVGENSRSSFPYIEKEYSSSDGKVKTYHISLFPLRQTKSMESFRAALIQDITEQKAIMSQLIQASKMTAIGELAGNIAHEINNPVGIISFKSRLLLQDYEQLKPEKIKSDIADIGHLADRAVQITKGLLRFARPSVEKKSAININDALKNTLGLVEHSLSTSKIETQLSLHSASIRVYGNANELEQVFLNIIANAQDAMPKGGVLSISSGIEQESVVIMIQDSGEGLEPGSVDRIFEPFFTTKETGKGTGLGLSICKGIVESYGGIISLESEPGKGTTVLIRMPLFKDKELTKG